MKDVNKLIPGLALPEQAIDPFYVDWMKNTNIQHIELVSGKDGPYIYVNGEPMPYLTWEGDSLKNLGAVMGLAGLPYGQLITKLMPIIQRTGVNIAVKCPTQEGAAEIPMRDPTQAPQAVEAVASDQPAALITKIDVNYDENGVPMLAGKHIFEAIDGSLRRLGMDYVDLYQIHRFDPETPIEETLEALHDVVKSGKARYIGASSLYAWQFTKMLYTQTLDGWTRFVSMQNHYNLVYREEEREMLPLCREEGIGVIPWSPLARGFLAGNRQRGRKDATRREQHDEYGHTLYYADADYTVVDQVVDVARAKGVRPIQIALASVMRQPAVTAQKLEPDPNNPSYILTVRGRRYKLVQN